MALWTLQVCSPIFTDRKVLKKLVSVCLESVDTRESARESVFSPIVLHHPPTHPRGISGFFSCFRGAGHVFSSSSSSHSRLLLLFLLLLSNAPDSAHFFDFTALPSIWNGRQLSLVLTHFRLFRFFENCQGSRTLWRGKSIIFLIDNKIFVTLKEPRFNMTMHSRSNANPFLPLISLSRSSHRKFNFCKVRSTAHHNILASSPIVNSISLFTFSIPLPLRCHFRSLRMRGANAKTLKSPRQGLDTIYESRDPMAWLDFLHFTQASSTMVFDVGNEFWILNSEFWILRAYQSHHDTQSLSWQKVSRKIFFWFEKKFF